MALRFVVSKTPTTAIERVSKRYCIAMKRNNMNTSTTTTCSPNNSSDIKEKRQKPTTTISACKTNSNLDTFVGINGINEEDKYIVQIKNNFMKVSMPISTQEQQRTESKLSSTGIENEHTRQSKITDSVLQFQRQLRKTQAAKRASTPLLKSQLEILHNDASIIVVNKPSGVLSVPGVNSNPSMLTLLHNEFKNEIDPEMKRDHMIIHRLDMDTSGIIIYAKSKKSMSNLQASFRDRTCSKHYEALVCGHINPEVEKGCIDLPLQRDHRFPPFMRCATPKSEREAKETVKDLQHAGWKKIVKKNPKPSKTMFEVLKREYTSGGGEVTRLRLTPVTGRTHQLRVHCASIGHPILGDPTYGVYGEVSLISYFKSFYTFLFNSRELTYIRYFYFRSYS
ncbi:MAG: tRNA pseudouridine32 synthase/23S rRNA pseudouridine746 synthase [Bacillariaceae sp.]|jgi:23S rRNA-/tRNA-specific pseudouridylate synthase